MVGIKTIEHNLEIALDMITKNNFGQAQHEVRRVLSLIRGEGITGGVTIDQDAFNSLVQAAKRQ